MKRGEIWWATLPDLAGSEPGYRRPVVVVQADAFNRSAIQTVICAAITSKVGLSAAPGNIRIGTLDSGLSKPSVVNVSQLITLDKTLLTEHVNTLDTHVLRQLDEGLRLALNL